jgi:hypothetical protein
MLNHRRRVNDIAVSKGEINKMKPSSWRRNEARLNYRSMALVLNRRSNGFASAVGGIRRYPLVIEAAGHTLHRELEVV